MFSRPKILFLVSLLFVALLNSIPTYLLNFKFFRVRSRSPTQILAFVTGAFKIPPMGFPTRPTITFITDKSLFLPTASTCALSLKLPLSLVSYESFKENMTMAILNTIGFGQV